MLDHKPRSVLPPPLPARERRIPAAMIRMFLDMRHSVAGKHRRSPDRRCLGVIVCRYYEGHSIATSNIMNATGFGASTVNRHIDVLLESQWIRSERIGRKVFQIRTATALSRPSAAEFYDRPKAHPGIAGRINTVTGILAIIFPLWYDGEFVTLL